MNDAGFTGALWRRRLLLLMIAAAAGALPVAAQEATSITAATVTAEVDPAPTAGSEQTLETPATGGPNSGDPERLESPPPVPADKDPVLAPTPDAAPARQGPGADNVIPNQRPTQPLGKEDAEIGPDSDGGDLLPSATAQAPAQDAAGQAASPEAETSGDQPKPEAEGTPKPVPLDDDAIGPDSYDSDVDDLLPSAAAEAPAQDVAGQAASPEAETASGNQPEPQADRGPTPIRLDGDEIVPDIYDSDFHDLLPAATAKAPVRDAAGQAASPEAETSGDQPDPQADDGPTPIRLDSDEIVPDSYDSDVDDLLPDATTEPPAQDAVQAATPATETATPGDEPEPAMESGVTTSPGESAPGDAATEVNADAPEDSAAAGNEGVQPSIDDTPRPGAADEGKTPPETGAPVRPDAQTTDTASDDDTPAGAPPAAKPAPADSQPPVEAEVYDSDIDDMLPRADADEAEEPEKKPTTSAPVKTTRPPPVAEKPAPAPTRKATKAAEPSTAAESGAADGAAAGVQSSDIPDETTATGTPPTGTAPALDAPAPPLDAEKGVSAPPGEPPAEDAVWWQDRWIKPWEEEWIVEQEEWGLDGLRYVDKWGLLRMKLGGNIAIDTGGAWQQTELDTLFPEVNEWETIARNARLQLVGSFGPHLFFKVQLEMGSINPGFKDAYVVLGDVPLFSNIRFGKGKQPFSMENLTSSKFNTFMERSLLTALTPGRSFGVMAYDSAFGQRFTWAGGLFYRSANWGDLEFDTAGGGDATLRITGLPYYLSDSKLMHLGFGVSNRIYSQTTSFASPPESRLYDVEYVDTGDFEADSASTFNFEGAWKDGSWLLQGEYTRNFVRTGNDERTYSARYVQLSYFVTGESRPYNRSSGTFGKLIPSRPYHWGDEPGGALELALRLSAIDLRNQDNPGGLQEDITLGATWYPRENIRVMLNYVTGHVDAIGDTLGSRTKGRFNIVQTRVSFEF